MASARQSRGSAAVDVPRHRPALAGDLLTQQPTNSRRAVVLAEKRWPLVSHSAPTQAVPASSGAVPAGHGRQQFPPKPPGFSFGLQSCGPTFAQTASLHCPPAASHWACPEVQPAVTAMTASNALPMLTRPMPKT